jgi:GH15 family glucan-1,4-alpha-glucosidase
MMTRVEEYALLGDTRSAALVSPYGSVDWWCLPHFDGEPVCGRLLGKDDAGQLLIGPVPPMDVIERDYLPGQLTLTEGMVSSVVGRLLPATLMVRRVEAVDAPTRVQVRFAPRHGWRGDRPRLQYADGRVIARLGRLAMAMTSDPPLRMENQESVEFDLRPSEPLTIAVTAAWREPLVRVSPQRAWQELCEDAARWRAWSQDVPTDVPFRSAVQRTLLVLRLLTFSPSGAPVGAVTTSLPEEIGGIRNWDYRFTWPRDAGIGVAAFLGLGKTAEARMFFNWLLHASRLDRPRLPALFTLAGRRVPYERHLEDWPGYQESRPVRTGNGARDQHQLDGYGWLVDAMSIYAQRQGPITGEAWRAVSRFVDYVAKRWPDPDAGIWEVRHPPAQHTHSKLMAWLVLDRALRLAESHPIRQTKVRRWRTARDAIATEVRNRGFNSDLGSYTRTYGSNDVDAALLVLPLLGLEPPDSPRVTGTIDAVCQQLSAGGPFCTGIRQARMDCPAVREHFCRARSGSSKRWRGLAR